MSEKKDEGFDNGETAFNYVCNTIIALIIGVILIGFVAIVVNILTGRNPNWSVPVEIVGGEE